MRPGTEEGSLSTSLGCTCHRPKRCHGRSLWGRLGLKTQRQHSHHTSPFETIQGASTLGLEEQFQNLAQAWQDSPLHGGSRKRVKTVWPIGGLYPHFAVQQSPARIAQRSDPQASRPHEVLTFGKAGYQVHCGTGIDPRRMLQKHFARTSMHVELHAPITCPQPPIFVGKGWIHGPSLFEPQACRHVPHVEP